MDISSIINQAGGVSAIANQLGINEATVESGVAALLPHVNQGIQKQGLPDAPTPTSGEPTQAPITNDDAGLGGMIGGLLGGAGGGGGILGNLISGGVGNQILGHIFGSKDGSRDVAVQASDQSGIDTSVLKKLLPIVAGAVAMHYMTNRNQADGSPIENGGVGGILGSIIGNLGSR